MFTHKTSGKVVTLLAQDGQSICHFEDDGGHKHTLPSHVFFATYGDTNAQLDPPPPRPARRATTASKPKAAARRPRKTAPKADAPPPAKTEGK